MIYPYRCVMCGHHEDVIKPAAECRREEICSYCSIVMKRVWTVPLINCMTLTLEDRAYVSKYKNDTGNDLVCVGDDKKIVQALTPRLSEYPGLDEISSEYKIED